MHDPRNLFLGLGMALAGCAELLLFASTATGGHDAILRLLLVGICVAIAALIVAAIAPGRALPVNSRLRIAALILSSLWLQLVGTTVVLFVPDMRPLARWLELLTGLAAIVLSAASCWQLWRARGTWPPVEAKRK